MRRRDLFSVISIASSLSVLSGGLRLSAEEVVKWSSAVNSLSIGLRLDSDPPHGHMQVFLKNTSSAPQDLFFSFSDVDRVGITAKAAGGKEYALIDRKFYRPCAGLCGMPITKRLNAGATHKTMFALEDLLYVTAEGVEANLGDLLGQGCTVRIAFEVTEQQLKDNKISPEDPWLGRVESGEVRIH